MVKEDVLQALEQERGKLISGGALAKELNVSRTAVWKAITALRSEGFPIESVAGGGYCLAENSDALSAAGISLQLTTGEFGHSIDILQEIDSTSNYLKREYEHLPHGHVAIANRQTGGRGRRGRSFESPAGSGLYLSILLFPDIPLEQINMITVGTAVAACHAIEETAGYRPDLKWVNDVLMNGKKLCGILTEAAVEAENGSLSYAVVGIGFNVHVPEGGFPEELQSIAGNIEDFSDRPVQRNILAARFLNHLERCYSLIVSGDTAALIADYRSCMAFLGQEIRIINGSTVETATALDVNEQGHLIVDQNGQRRALFSGEISIRLDGQTDMPKPAKE